MVHTASVVLVGMGGFGQTYLEGIMQHAHEEVVDIAGIVEPYPERCATIGEVKKRKIPVYSTLEDFYAVSHAEFAVIASPIQFHQVQACTALEKGSHVLCEKPICATLQDAHKMIEARNRSGKVLAIGYQWSYSDEILQMKRDILSGMYGQPIRLKTVVLWPRGLKYYSRSWAGTKKDATGRWVLDSIANNAAAHYLHNMFFVTGSSMESSSVPKNVQSELYRANNIENYDTTATRVFTDKGVEIMFFASHAHALEKGNRLSFCYEFTNGVIVYEDNNGEITFEGRLKGGTVIRYNTPSIDSYMKLLRVISQIREDLPVSCGPEAALSHTMTIHAMQKSMPEITIFPDMLIKMGTLPSGDKALYVEGLFETMMDGYNHWKLPSEIGVSWAKTGRKINL